MKYKSMYPWMVLDMGFFIAVNILLIRVLEPSFDILASASFLQVVVFGLAVYRGANIVANEFITKPVRAYFVQEVEKDGKMVEAARDEGFRGFLGSLLYCPSCVGVWISTILIYAYLAYPAQTSVIIMLLALSGLERFFAYAFGRIKK